MRLWLDWMLRFAKGMLIGTGAILPGVSGGALAAVFGLYQRMIGFLSDIRRNFRRDALFFLPVGLGGLFGVFLLSFGVGWMLEKAEAQLLWLFVGCIAGTLPALWRQAGERGRRPRHLLLAGVTAAVLGWMMSRSGPVGALPQNTLTWCGAGAVIGLGVLVPGLSPSNLLVWLGLYKPMTDAIQTVNLPVLLPLGAGLCGCVLGLSKVMGLLFEKAYAGVFHIILGALVASTWMIAPVHAEYDGAGAVMSAINLLLGAGIGYGMSCLEDRKKVS